MRQIVLALTLLMTTMVGIVPAVAAESALEVLDAKVDYEADYYLTVPNGTYQGRVFHARGLERREFGTTGGGQVLLVNRRDGMATMLTPRIKMWTSLTIQAVSEMVGGMLDMGMDRIKDGPEIILGETTERYNVTANSSKGRFQGQMWFTEEGILMKAAGTITYQGKDTPFETGLSNLRRIRQDVALFQVPKDYWGLALQAR